MPVHDTEKNCTEAELKQWQFGISTKLPREPFLKTSIYRK